MHCPNCNEENVSSAKFCKKCGKSLLQAQNQSNQNEFQDADLQARNGNLVSGVFVVTLILVAGAFLVGQLSSTKNEQQVVTDIVNQFDGMKVEFPQKQSLLGMWSASDGSIKVFNADGTCGVGLGDGPQNCTLSISADNKNRYTLFVTRPFDVINLLVKNDSSDKMSVFDESGKLLWTMTRK